MDIPVPIAVKPTVINGKQFLRIWTGAGDPIVVESPIKPHLFSRKAMEIPRAKSQTVEMISNATKEPFKFKRYTFENTKDADKAQELRQDTFIQPTENFTDLINQTLPDYFRDFPSRNVKCLYLDIEQMTDGTRFPTHDDFVVSIAWAINDEPVQQMHFTGEDDSALLAKLAEVIVQEDPDIIVGYNLCKYDLPVLIARLDGIGVEPNLWSRDSAQPFFYTKQIGPNEITCCAVGGRIIYDVFHSVMTDLTLNGEKRGLKPVSKHYAKNPTDKDFDPEIHIAAGEIIEEDTSNIRAIVLTDKLAAYNKSDVNLTRKLFKMYFKNNLAVSEFTGAPLNRTCPLSATFAFTQELGRLYQRKNILAESSNAERYPWAFNNLGTYTDENGEESKQKPYQGAVCKCFTPNTLMTMLIECDVNSLYPFIIVSLGAGPDNTRILRTESLQAFRVEVSGEVRTYYLPDKVRGWTWVVEVKGYSEVATLTAEYLAKRMEIKQRSKKENSVALYSMAYALKVTLNSEYGMAGNQDSPWGELGVAVLTTISGRMIIEEAARFVPETVYIDTDSVKFPESTGKTNIDMNNHFARWVPEVLKGKPCITWDQEVIESIYLKQEKSYILINHKGEFIKKGGAFKSTKYTDIFNKVIDRVGPILLKDGRAAAITAAREMTKVESYSPDDFIMSVKLGKEMKDYKNANSLAPKVARMALEAKGIEPYKGQTIEYVKIQGGYAIPSPSSLMQLDVAYYTQIVRDACERMGLDDAITDGDMQRLSKARNQSCL